MIYNILFNDYMEKYNIYKSSLKDSCFQEHIAKMTESLKEQFPTLSQSELQEKAILDGVKNKDKIIVDYVSKNIELQSQAKKCKAKLDRYIEQFKNVMGSKSRMEWILVAKRMLEEKNKCPAKVEFTRKKENFLNSEFVTYSLLQNGEYFDIFRYFHFTTEFDFKMAGLKDYDDSNARYGYIDGNSIVVDEKKFMNNPERIGFNYSEEKNIIKMDYFFAESMIDNLICKYVENAMGYTSKISSSKDM